MHIYDRLKRLNLNYSKSWFITHLNSGMYIAYLSFIHGQKSLDLCVRAGCICVISDIDEPNEIQHDICYLEDDPLVIKDFIEHWFAHDPRYVYNQILLDIETISESEIF